MRELALLTPRDVFCLSSEGRLCLTLWAPYDPCGSFQLPVFGTVRMVAR